MKKIVISCIFVLNAFQVSASQEDGLLGILTFSSSIAFVMLNQRDALITQPVFSNKNDQKNNNQEVHNQKIAEPISNYIVSEIFSEVAVTNENICVQAVYDHNSRASIPSGLHVPVGHDEDDQHYDQSETDIDPLSESTVFVSAEMY